MALMIDRIDWKTLRVKKKWLELPAGDICNLGEIDKTIASLRERPVFDITNVADYFYQSDDQFPLDSSFPNVAPPFDFFWMEFDWPQQVNKGNGKWIDISDDETRRAGFMVDCFGDNGEWDFYFWPFFEHFNGSIQFPDTLFAIKALDYGRELKDTGVVSLDNTFTFDEAVDRFPHGITGTIGPILLALSFLNCKNVRVENKEGIHPSRQARREAQRRGDRPLISYRTLEIEPMKKVLATEGGIATNGLKKALHICRGHFSEYGDEYGKGKLFGKHEGRFWMPAHVRGSSEVGIANKDYKVNAPRKDAA